MISKGKEGDKTVVVLVVSLTQSAPCGTAPLYTKVYIVIEHQQHNSYDDFGKLGSWLIKDQGGGEKIQKLENYGRKVFLVNVPPSQSGKMISMEENCKIWCFFKNVISAQKSDHCSNLELQSEIEFLKQFRIFSFVGIRVPDSGIKKKSKIQIKKIKIVGRDQEPLINLLIQNIFLQPKLIIRVLTNWSQSFNGISGFLGFEGWVPWKPCLDVFLLRIYFQNLQIASKMRDADSHHHAPVIAKETSFFFVR